MSDGILLESLFKGPKESYFLKGLLQWRQTVLLYVHRKEYSSAVID